MSTIEDVKNPIYADATGQAINCDVKFDTLPMYVPFTATSYDVEPHGRELYAQLEAGQWGPIAPYVPPPAPVVDPAKQAGPTVVA
jgi:hypothetical protein